MGEFSHGPAWLPHLARSNCCQGRLHQGTFNNHIVLSSMNIVLQLSDLRLSTALSPSPTGREGYCLMWSILGCAAGQDMVLVLCAYSSTGYGQYDRHSISFFCPKQGQGIKPAASPLHPNIDQKPLSPPPPPSGAGGHRSSAALQNLD